MYSRRLLPGIYTMSLHEACLMTFTLAGGPLNVTGFKTNAGTLHHESFAALTRGRHDNTVR